MPILHLVGGEKEEGRGGKGKKEEGKGRGGGRERYEERT